MPGMNLVKASDLEAWSRSLTARANLPGVVASLIRSSCPTLQSYRFPSGDASQTHGFDRDSTLVPFVLAGGWDAQNEYDRAAMEKLCNTRYENIDASARKFASIADPPIDLDGAVWTLRSPTDAFTLLGSLIDTAKYQTGQATCTTTTTSAPTPPISTEQAFEAGQNLGRGIASIRARHWVNKFCKKSPGQTWSYRNPVAGIDASGVCPGNSARRGGDREAEANSWHTQKYCEKGGFVWVDGACHASQIRSRRASTTPSGVECPSDRYASRDPESCRKAWGCN